MNAHDRLRKARTLALEGQFEEALAEFEWFHENSLIEDPSLRGVRRSFALSYWAELGEQYPPALRALIALRDRNRTSLLAGLHDNKLFADIEAINRYLSDEQATYRLFSFLHENAPAFAIDCFDSAINAIVANHDFRLARSYILEPGAAVSVLLRDFNEAVKNAFQLSDKRHRAIRLQGETRNFVSDVLVLLSVVRNTDGAAESEQLARAALFGVSEETVRRRVGRKIGA
jgi:hypothetical protein